MLIPRTPDFVKLSESFEFCVMVVKCEEKLIRDSSLTSLKDTKTWIQLNAFSLQKGSSCKAQSETIEDIS